MNYALQRMAAGRRSCNRCAWWLPSLSLIHIRSILESSHRLILGSFTLGLSLLLASCASPCNSFGLFMLYPLAAFDPHTYRGHDGSGLANAVVLSEPKGERQTAEAESAYIYKTFDVDSGQAQRQTEQVGRSTYHVVAIQTKGGKTKRVWFDVTSTIQ